MSDQEGLLKEEIKGKFSRMDGTRNSSKERKQRKYDIVVGDVPKLVTPHTAYGQKR